MVRSAQFPGLHGDGSHPHEWNLRSPADIIQVFILIKNIDRWTHNGFVKCIEAGIADLEDSVLVKRCAYQPWKRVGTLKPSKAKEAYNSSSQPSAAPTVAHNTRSRSRRRARHS